MRGDYMLFKDFVESVLMEMGEYSNSGTLISESENKDYLLSATRLTNDALTQIATLGKTNSRTFDISHFKPNNQYGALDWNEELYHDTDDVIFQAVGTQAYSFQVGDTADIYIEEEIAGVWTNLVTINHVDVDGQGYVNYKGLITLTSVLNNVRIRFSGTYYYPLRWIAGFKEKLSRAIAFEPYVPYSIGTKFYALDSVKFLHADMQNEDYANYKFDKSTKSILFNWYERGEFKVNYFAYPTPLTTSSTDVHIADNETIDIPDEFIESLKMQVANKLKAAVDQKYGEADRFVGMFSSNLTEAVKNKQKDTGLTSIQSLSGW